jgi:hypothetical protein
VSLVHNEQTKLTAGAFDRLSTACFALGVIAPIVAASFGAPGYSIGLALIGFSLGWLIVSLGLHFLARTTGGD